MAKHPHYDVMMEWAADTSKVVQCKRGVNDSWSDVGNPTWSHIHEYRIKPEKKPDVVYDRLIGIVCNDLRLFSTPNKSNLRLTFDGEDGTLKHAEVLHADR